jgi:hypothetical protein
MERWGLCYGHEVFKLRTEFLAPSSNPLPSRLSVGPNDLKAHFVSDNQPSRDRFQYYAIRATLGN